MSDEDSKTEQQQEEQTPKKEPMSPSDMVFVSGGLLRKWNEQLMMIWKLYMSQYPTGKTNPDVIQAVTVQVPYPAFLAMMTAVQAVNSMMDAASPKKEAANDEGEKTE